MFSVKPQNEPNAKKLVVLRKLFHESAQATASYWNTQVSDLLNFSLTGIHRTTPAGINFVLKIKSFVIFSDPLLSKQKESFINWRTAHTCWTGQSNRLFYARIKPYLVLPISNYMWGFKDSSYSENSLHYHSLQFPKWRTFYFSSN